MRGDARIRLNKIMASIGILQAYGVSIGKPAILHRERIMMISINKYLERKYVDKEIDIS